MRLQIGEITLENRLESPLPAKLKHTHTHTHRTELPYDRAIPLSSVCIYMHTHLYRSPPRVMSLEETILQLSRKFQGV